MILYRDDWRKYPKAIPHYTTKNKSWVRTAALFNKMGITNSLFHLSLLNPELATIDPHSDDLNESEITMIINECLSNPWYILREVIRVPPPAGIEPVFLRGNRANISAYWLYFNHITTMLIQPRQTGKSVSIESLTALIIAIDSVNYNFSLLTKNDDLRVKTVNRIKDIINCLPAYLNLRQRNDTNNTEKITVRKLGNTYHTSVAQSSKKLALNVGRGSVYPSSHIDEIAFSANMMITVPALLAGSVAARESAKEHNAHYGNIFTTTPGYLHTDAGAYAYNLYSGSFVWSETLFDAKDVNELTKYISTNSSGALAMVVLDYNHRQLGYTDEDFKSRIATALSSGDAALSDFLGIWPTGSNASIIPKDKVKIITMSKRNDYVTIMSDFGYIMRSYVSEDELQRMTLVGGLDTSDAVGKDDIALVLRDIKTGSVVAAGDFNETNTITFARWLAATLIKFPNITLVPERRSSAISIIDALIEILLANNVDPFKRIFNWVVNDHLVKKSFHDDIISTPFVRRSPDVYIKYRKYFGYATSGAGRTSRGVLYNEGFQASVKYTSDTVHDQKLVSQVLSLTVKNNRVDHPTGGSDDLVIAWLLGYWFLTKAENMSYYGVTRRHVLTNVAESKITEAGGQDAIDERNFQLDLKTRIDDLVDKIKMSKSRIMSLMMINKLKFMYRDIDASVIQCYSLEALLESLELERKQNNLK